MYISTGLLAIDSDNNYHQNMCDMHLEILPLLLGPFIDNNLKYYMMNTDLSNLGIHMLDTSQIDRHGEWYNN